MAKEFNFPPELCLQILQYIWASDTPTQLKRQTLRSTRLVNRTWSQSASELLFRDFTIYGSRDLGADLRRVAVLKQISQTMLAPLIRNLTVELSLYGDCDDEKSMDQFQDLFTNLTLIFPEAIPKFPGLEQLRLILLGRNEMSDAGYGDQKCAVVDYAFAQLAYHIPFEFVGSIGKSLSMAPLPNLHTLSLDLFTMCDLATILQAGESADAGKPSYFRQNIKNLRTFGISHNILMCTGLDECPPETYHDDLSATSSNDLACRPFCILKLFDYGLDNLESLTVECSELQNVCIDMHDMWPTVPFQNLRYIRLHKTFISVGTLKSIMERSKDTLEELYIHWSTGIQSVNTDIITDLIKSMPNLQRAKLVSEGDSFVFDRPGLATLKGASES
ncbi:hypothetical protein BDV25DRAFT_161066 [Aspergillus avenaceus]|uniref:F-box domain-containing protein n=1 Tax=Aspergillus avenaceus TaxID=36643 RepID=A0A5N6TL92_ASPAV|nr:hypothetical protein BDV25DRAFT_161066 [Aspergillus avenaceus]